MVKGMHIKTILIDLDGVLNNYTKYEENFIPDIKDGAKNFWKNCLKNMSLFCLLQGIKLWRRNGLKNGILIVILKK